MEQKDIDRITPLIRGLYYRQEVVIWPHQSLTNPYCLNSSDMFGGLEDSYLLLRPLSSITNPEINLFKHLCGFSKDAQVVSFYIDWEESEFCINGRDDGYYGITFKALDYLRQQSFALPYYDSITNTTLTPEQMQEYGIIKLK